MIRGLPQFAALAAAAAASVALIGGAAQAVEPSNQGGSPGVGGSATIYLCRTWISPQNNASLVLCMANPGMPGAPGTGMANPDTSGAPGTAVEN